MSPTYHPLGRKPHQRKMLLRNLATSLVLYESIRTTKTRAKVLAPILEKMIHRAKGRPPALAIRSLNSFFTDKNACRKTMEVLLPRFKERISGYVRIVPLGRRIGDGAAMVEISLLGAPDAAVPIASAKRTKAVAA